MLQVRLLRYKYFFLAYLLSYLLILCLFRHTLLHNVHTCTVTPVSSSSIDCMVRFFYRVMLCYRGICCSYVSVRLSVTRRYCTKTAKRVIMQTTPKSPSESSLLVPKISAKLPQNHPQRRQIEVG